jgi:hypothetical protein
LSFNLFLIFIFNNIMKKRDEKMDGRNVRLLIAACRCFCAVCIAARPSGGREVLWQEAALNGYLLGSIRKGGFGGSDWCSVYAKVKRGRAKR